MQKEFLKINYWFVSFVALLLYSPKGAITSSFFWNPEKINKRMNAPSISRGHQSRNSANGFDIRRHFISFSFKGYQLSFFITKRSAWIHNQSSCILRREGCRSDLRFYNALGISISCTFIIIAQKGWNDANLKLWKPLSKSAIKRIFFWNV